MVLPIQTLVLAFKYLVCFLLFGSFLVTVLVFCESRVFAGVVYYNSFRWRFYMILKRSIFVLLYVVLI